MTLKERWTIVKQTIVEFLQEKPMAHGAALAYYALLSLVPLLYLSVTYLGMFLGQEEMTKMISTVIEQYIGLEDVGGILGLLDQVSFEQGSAFLQIIGIVALLFSCAAIFTSMKRSINEFYDVEVPKLGRRKMILSTIVSKLISMVFVVGATLILMVLYFVETVFLSFSDQFLEGLNMLHWLFSGAARLGIPILTNVILFMFIFKFLHNGKVLWRNALRGGIVTSALLYLGQVLIKFYLTNYFFASGAGVAGTFLVILVWVYYSSQIIFFGAKYIFVLSRMKGTPIQG
ncbi:MAG: YihY/virulence factor BrkB family protein [Crocinitomicaceae bacterium]